MANSGTLHDAFISELRDAYDAERQLTRALAKLAKSAANPDLRDAFEAHRRQTEGHIERLEQVFAGLDETVRGKRCDGIAGIIEEGKSVMEEKFDATTMDACLIAAGQRAEHYEMAAYGTLVAWAQTMGHTDAALDPISWTRSERWIRCPACLEAVAGARAGGSLRSSRKVPSGWSCTKARRSARWRASSI